MSPARRRAGLLRRPGAGGICRCAADRLQGDRRGAARRQGRARGARRAARPAAQHSRHRRTRRRDAANLADVVESPQALWRARPHGPCCGGLIPTSDRAGGRFPARPLVHIPGHHPSQSIRFATIAGHAARLQPPPLPTVMYRQALLASGVTEDNIRWAKSNGSWTKLHRGTYCSSESMTSLSKEGLHRLRAIALAGRSPQLVLSHVSAAAVHHLPLFGVQLDTIHLTRLGANGGRSQPGRVVHVADLRPDELLNRNGFRNHKCCSDTARLCLHRTRCQPRSSPPIMRCTTNWSRRDALAAVLSRTRHRRGAAAARRALLFANGRSESPGESRLRLDIHRAGLPAPVLQVRVYAPNGTFLGRVDLGYPELGLLIEFDGKIKIHEAPKAWAIDR